MQITRQTEYAVRTLLELSTLPSDQLLPTRVISERQDVPEVFLKKTVQILARAGLVITQRGTQGGVRLARPAHEITLLDVVTAVEGPLALNVCLAEGYNCPNQPHCQVRKILARAQNALVKELSRETLADIAGEEAEPVSDL
ncbi:MAG: Rrf2 family transcriptional regulator [Syntrophomonadaceae bacterium]|mgnify:CR=1 FL=1|nr:Rrf2 family transcriptional regulator [Syntrophomonadaceae bacterium]